MTHDKDLIKYKWENNYFSIPYMKIIINVETNEIEILLLNTETAPQKVFSLKALLKVLFTVVQQ